MTYNVEAVDWKNWKFKDRAVLCFIIKNGSILLIKKKRGLGAGKINGPGGRLEPDESPYNAAIRETEEEIGVTPLSVTQAGELSFLFTNGYSLYGTVFKAADYRGTPIETDEAVPQWVRINEIPYDQMWEDDELWYPLMLGNCYFHGFFIFDDDILLSSKIEAL